MLVATCNPAILRVFSFCHPIQPTVQCVQYVLYGPDRQSLFSYLKAAVANSLNMFGLQVGS